MPYSITQIYALRVGRAVEADFAKGLLPQLHDFLRIWRRTPLTKTIYKFLSGWPEEFFLHVEI